MIYVKRDFAQGTDEWHEWRRQGLGASDAPIILGESPYSNPHKLWQSKTGVVPPDDKWKYIYEKGHKIEAAARARYELMNDKECPPCCLEMVEFPFIRASLDGFNETGNFILEVKYVGKDAMEDAIKSYHYTQLQHQMMVSGAKDVTFIRSNDGQVFKTEVIDRNENLISYLQEQEIKFWRMVLDKREPSLPEKKTRRKK